MKTKINFRIIIFTLLLILSFGVDFKPAQADCVSDCEKTCDDLAGSVGVGVNFDCRAQCPDGCKENGKFKPTIPAPTPAAGTTGGAFTYEPMEEIPGFGRPTDFPTYIVSVYKFGLWVIGLAAVMMIMIGGFMYITSAGNNSSMGKAKGIITDALIGLILALTSWVLLNTINPELVTFKGLTPGGIGGSGYGGGGSGSSGPGPGGTGSCQPITNAANPCSVEKLKTTCFGEANAEKASGICNAESGGNESIASGVDKCRPLGEAVSFGLFQINISANNIGGKNCPSAFTDPYTGSDKNCSVTNKALYDQCVTSARTPSDNIQAACSISKGGTKWSPWGANKKCKY